MGANDPPYPASTGAMILENISEAVIAIDPAGCVTYWGRGAATLYGIDEKEAIGRPLTELYQYRWASPDEERQAYASLECDGRWRGGNVHVLRSGEELFVESTVTVLRDDQGGEAGLLAVIRDQTDRVQAERARAATEEALRRSEQQLRESEARFRAVLESSIDCIYRVNLRTGRYEYISPNVEQMIGYSPAEILAMSPEDAFAVIHPADRPLFEVALRQTGAFEVEYRLRGPDGAYRWYANRMLVELDDQGRPSFRNGTIHDIEDRKRREDALRDAHERLAAALEASPVVLFSQDLELRSIWLYNHRLGFAPEEYLGKTDYDLFDTVDDAERVTAIKRRVLETGQPARAEVCVQPRGKIFWYDMSVRPRFADGKICGVLGTATDITARKQLEEEQVRSREALLVASQRLEAAQRVGGIGIFDWELGSGRVYWSPEVYKLMGLSPGAIPATPQAWDDALVGEDRERAWRVFREAVAARREHYEVEVRLRHAQDGARWVRVSALVRYDDQGEPLHVLGTIIDIEALKQAAQDREAERRRVLTLLEQVPAVVNFLRGPDLVFEFAHPRTLALVGGRDVLGKPLHAAAPELREQLPYERLRRVYETGAPFIQKEALVSYEIDGRRVETYWDTVYLPVRTASGIVEGVMTFANEVTQNVRARHELEQVNRAKDEFLATMSHELRTPLHAILGWATILRMKPRDADRLDRGLEVIERNAKTQERLINDLLDVSRIISGKLQLRLRRTEVSAVVVAAVDVVRPAAEAKGVRLVIDLDPDVGALIADADRLQQIVWNLLSNAVRFTPRGGRITVTAERTGGNVRIRVEDTGAGIPPEHLPHIFERFRQVDSSTTRAHGGLGLGLAIVRHLVEAHGGHVEAESDGPARGARFAVYLPIRAVDTSHPSAEGDVVTEPEVSDSRPEIGAGLRGVRVLVVDDDPDSLELLRTVLGGAGAAVTAAASAREAFDARGPFDVIVSDIGMPEMDGYAFMRRIRSRDVAGDIPAIALTAFARAEDAQRAMRSGFQEHLKKPVEPEKLVAAVKAWADPRRSLREPS